jgi:predicted O-methyltransferase YrrM
LSENYKDDLEQYLNGLVQDEATQAIRQATDMLTHSANWISSLLPIRDGLLVAYKAG